MDRSQSVPEEAGASERNSPETAAAAVAGHDPAELGTGELLDQLGRDRLWLLRQLDAGRWPEWRLDLAALERELGQLLEQAGTLREPG